MVEELTDSLMRTFSGEGRRPVHGRPDCETTTIYSTLMHSNAV